MEKVRTRHFQYTGLDDFDKSIEEQMNEFFESECVSAEQIISVKYSAHSTEGINTYTALVVYKTK
ncbi:MAG: sporulation protein Cse60 [Marinilabiliaceae bacterium]|nr:sporulation protein Cse60 [Marinilabiliaceae bacterium]